MRGVYGAATSPNRPRCRPKSLAAVVERLDQPPAPRHSLEHLLGGPVPPYTKQPSAEVYFGFCGWGPPASAPVLGVRALCLRREPQCAARATLQHPYSHRDRTSRRAKTTPPPFAPSFARLADVSEPGCALPMEDKPTKWMSVSKAECAALPRCTWRPTVRVASGQCVEREQATCGELQVRQQLLNYGPDFCVLSQTNFSSKSCAPSMSRPDAARHCRALGMRLCHVAEQVALSSQNYGCGLSGEILWANDYCPKVRGVLATPLRRRQQAG